jgi:hypothetical protein
MTSFGIEWETNAVTLKLPPGKKEKRPVLEGRDWSVTLEGRWFYETRDGKKEEPKDSKDCMYGLEVQLGPFFSSNPTQFDVRGIISSCSDFNRKVWMDIAKNKYMTITGEKYPVLSYHIGETDEPRFVDCGLTEPGHLYNTKGSEWGYIASLDNIVGKTQYTIGIQLKYVFTVFRRYVKLLQDCRLDKSKCATIVHQARLEYLTDAYFDTYKQCRKVKIPVDNHKLLSFIMLCNYTINTLYGKFKEYYKALYHVKPRSNFASIFDRLLNSEEKEMFLDWADMRLDEIHEQDKSKGDFIQNWLQQIATPIHQGYTIKDENVGKYEIITSDDETITKKGEKVPYALLPNYKNPTTATVVNDRIVVKLGQDVQEWTTGSNGEVYLEFRSPETVISLLDKEIHQKYMPRSGKEAAGAYGQIRLALITQQFVQVFLNPMFSQISEIQRSD